MQQSISSYNLATGNKWILSIPYKLVNANLKQSDMVMNLIEFEPPEFSTGDISVFIRGVEFSIPTNMRNEDKQINVTYKPSSDFAQLKFLYAWFNNISDENGVPKADTSGDYMGPVSITLISEYKTPIYTITYHDAWLNNIGKLALSYQNGGDTITQTFGFKYSHYTIEGLIEQEDCP
jgi:hypothetical protein